MKIIGQESAPRTNRVQPLPNVETTDSHADLSIPGMYIVSQQYANIKHAKLKRYRVIKCNFQPISKFKQYRVSLKKGNPSFRVHYSIIKNYYLFLKMYTSLESSLSLLSYDTILMMEGSRMTEQGQFVLGNEPNV